MGDPVMVLLEDPDPVRRARAHLALGQQALARDAVASATEHLREALDLDPTDETPRELLRQLGAERRRRPSWWPFKARA
jgi:Flp pilus assembly protein TadD